MTINAEISGAGKHKAECRQHHMGNALFGVAHIEKPKTMTAGRLARRINEDAAAKAGMGLEGWDRMVLHHHRQIGRRIARARRSKFLSTCGARTSSTTTRSM